MGIHQRTAVSDMIRFRFLKTHCCVEICLEREKRRCWETRVENVVKIHAHDKPSINLC